MSICLQVLELMEARAVKPDVQSFSLVMNAWSSAGLVDEARSVLDRMQAANVKPDVFVYTILAKGYVRSQRPVEAEALLERMISEGVNPNVYTYTTIISGWCSLGQMEDALRVLNHMETRGVEPNLNTFHTLIWGFGEARQPHRADEILDTMQKIGIAPDRKCMDLVGEAWNAVGLPATLQLKEAREPHMMRTERGGASDSTDELGKNDRDWSNDTNFVPSLDNVNDTSLNLPSEISSSLFLSQTMARAAPPSTNLYVNSTYSKCRKRVSNNHPHQRNLFAVSILVHRMNKFHWSQNLIRWQDVRVASRNLWTRRAGTGKSASLTSVDVAVLPSLTPFTVLALSL